MYSRSIAFQPHKLLAGWSKPLLPPPLTQRAQHDYYHHHWRRSHELRSKLNAYSSNALNAAMAGGHGNPLQELMSGEAGQGADGSGISGNSSGGQGSSGNSKKGNRRMWVAKEEGEQMHRELHSLNVAIGVNVIICLAKVWVHLISGSSAMLAEALHSVADILNQVLLRVGVLKAKRAPTPQHPYGYMRDRFVWSLISAVGIFFLGAGASVIHGLHTLMEVRVLEGELWSYAVLGLSAVLEGYSLLVAARYVMAGAAAHRMSMLQYIKSGLDPTTVAVMLEDGGAVAGLVIAGVCTALTHHTGNAMWDAAGSIAVGGLLGMIAMFLVQKNRDLLLGRSMGHADSNAILLHLQKDPVVAFVTDTKTEEIGPGIFRFKAEVAWNGDKLVERYLERCGRSRVEAALRHALSPMSHPSLLDGVMKSYGRDIINAVGAEVDRIEAEIQAINPGCRYVDLETDRGRFSADPVLRDAFASMMNGPQSNEKNGSPGTSTLGEREDRVGMDGLDEASPIRAGADGSRSGTAFAAAAGLGGIAGVAAPQVVQQHHGSDGAPQGSEVDLGSSGAQGNFFGISNSLLAGEQQQPPAGALERAAQSGFAGAVLERARSSSHGANSSEQQQEEKAFGQTQQGAAGQQQQQQGQDILWDGQARITEERLAAWDNSPCANSFGEEDYKEVYLESGEVGSTLDGSSFGDGTGSAQAVSAFVADYPCSLCDIPLEHLELEDQLLQQEQCGGSGSRTRNHIEEQGAYSKAPGHSNAEHAEHGGGEDVGGEGAVGKGQGR